jgi:hypothetical protein
MGSRGVGEVILEATDKALSNGQFDDGCLLDGGGFRPAAR